MSADLLVSLEGRVAAAADARKAAATSRMEAEAVAHSAFAARRAKGFQGRKSLLEALLAGSRTSGPRTCVC